MKLKREPIGTDLYVVHANPTEKDMKEMAEFVKEHKEKQAIKARRALAHTKGMHLDKKKKPKKYEVIEANMAIAHEPEPDLFVVTKPFTKAEKKKLSKIIEKHKKKYKLKYPKGLQG